jgi:hypothetical protein
MTVSDLLEQPCYQQSCYKLLTVCSKLVDDMGQAVRTQLVDGLLADSATRCEIFTHAGGLTWCKKERKKL